MQCPFILALGFGLEPLLQEVAPCADIWFSTSLRDGPRMAQDPCPALTEAPPGPGGQVCSLSAVEKQVSLGD